MFPIFTVQSNREELLYSDSGFTLYLQIIVKNRTCNSDVTYLHGRLVSEGGGTDVVTSVFRSDVAKGQGTVSTGRLTACRR